MCFTTLPWNWIPSALLTVIAPGIVSMIWYLLLCWLPSPKAMKADAAWTVAFPRELPTGTRL